MARAMVEREQGCDRSSCVEPRLTCANLSQLKRKHFRYGMGCHFGGGGAGGMVQAQACQGQTNLGIIEEGRGHRETPSGPVGLQAEPPTTACLHSLSFRLF